MQCPFLKKINFKKVNQIISEDCTSDDIKEQSNQCCIASDQDYNISDQTIEIINSSDVNKHNIYYFNSKINIPQSSNCHLEIKYPKQFQTKKMICPHQLMEIEEQSNFEEIVTECSIIQSKNFPHVLISKMSMLTAKCENIFYGDVILEDESQKQNQYLCEIKDKIIRLFKGEKTKYYIDMLKAKCNIQGINKNRGTLTAFRKHFQLKLRIRFQLPKKMFSFVKALQANNLQIKQQRQLQQIITKQNNLNQSYSIDSLGFEVERMDMAKLRQIGDTFDIILFKNKNIMSKVQRLFTNSEYDHVAMLLKTSSGELFILQSSSNAGVAVYTIQSLIDLPRNKYYYRVGLRQYKGQRSYMDLLHLQQFIKEAVGKKYKFDPMYLLSSQVQKEDTFFCSELVSQALQKAGIMNKNKPAYKYLPKHFSDQSFNEQIDKGQYSELIILQ